ncbi:NMDA receptor synaptonuclear signaling and neuronal migration factor isoform X10 [Denticeps clupeoides]|uniref:NMDA receptor synaptonuclear signaling and neuronal migration factor isoform X10 n=1 Tax=Denticeps clupeoides TaxID=299321 RepID=UPI0010A321E7|nr:NMDA receptor synaptonuclear signaling and neuronal migration factor isoform X10 [Denticeps clupeoides]
MGTAVSKRKNLRNDAISSVAAKVRAARAFGEYLSQNHPENQNGSDHLLSDTFVAQDSPDISRLNNNLQPLYPNPSATSKPSQAQPAHLPLPPTSSKRRLSVERSFSSESETTQHQPSQQKLKGGVETSLKPAQVYTITREGGMLGGRSSEESLELEVLKGGGEQSRPPSHPNGLQQLSVHQPSRNHHRSSHQRGNHSRSSHQPLQSSGSAHNIRDWGGRRGGSREDCTPDCVTCIRPPCTSQRSLDLETSPRDTAKHRKKLDRGFSEDRTSAEEREDNSSSWFPNENMFSFQTATTTMQAISNFRKHLRMVGSRRMKAQGGDLQTSSGTLDEEVGDEVDWEEEREMERAACEGDDFIPPKIMLISSKVPKAEYVPNIIRRDDPSIIPILYDHEHATFDDILDEVEKKLTAYRKGCKIWNMLIFCQGGPGHLYLLKNKVATFAKVEKEEDMSNFWRRLSRMMSLLNPKPNLIHIMGCYVLGNANGEKLFQNLKRLMRPYSIEFKSPLELSAQGKDMIEMYFDFRLFRLWKTRQHSKLLDYDDLL